VSAFWLLARVLWAQAAQHPKACGMTATLSTDRGYRYSLWRQWSGGGSVLNIIGLNPSTADETTDDPTVRRCIGFAKRLGFDALELTNLFAWRATSPGQLSFVRDPIGWENDEAIINAAEYAQMVVCAWGVHGGLYGRDQVVRDLLSNCDTWCFGITKDGHPRHPLYLRADSPLVDFP
jgi:hypothetical protein